MVEVEVEEVEVEEDNAGKGPAYRSGKRVTQRTLCATLPRRGRLALHHPNPAEDTRSHCLAGCSRVLSRLDVNRLHPQQAGRPDPVPSDLRDDSRLVLHFQDV